jgi:hypothetical protein
MPRQTLHLLDDGGAWPPPAKTHVHLVDVVVPKTRPTLLLLDGDVAVPNLLPG